MNISDSGVPQEVEEGEIEGLAGADFDIPLPPPPADAALKPVAGGRAPLFSTEGPSVPRLTSPTSAGGTRMKKPKKKSTQPEAVWNWQPGDNPIRLNDVQDLILSVLTHQTNSRFCYIKNKDLIPKVLVCAAHGIVEQLFEQLPEFAEGLDQLFGQPARLQARNPFIVPGQTAHGLLSVPRRRKRTRDSSFNGNSVNTSRNSVANNADDKEAGEYIEGDGTETAELDNIDDAAAGDDSTTPAAKRIKTSAGEDVGSHHVANLAVVGNGAVTEEKQPQAANKTPMRHTTTTPSSDLPPASAYVLSLEELEEHGYPLPVLDDDTGELICPPGFVATKSCGAGNQPAHAMVAVDCEMCITAEGYELTRATVTDADGSVLLDELVVPTNPITDYNTMYSGITAAMLQGVTTTLQDIQHRMLELVAAETLLVAHSGENDLKAMKIVHANVIDTSVMFPHPKGPPAKSALRVLTFRYLRRSIQKAEHNPIEDARAAMDLARLKISKGPLYGTNKPVEGDKLADILSRQGHRSTLIDAALKLREITGSNSSAVAAETDADAVGKAVKELKRDSTDFIWLQLTGLNNVYIEEEAKVLSAADVDVLQMLRDRKGEATHTEKAACTALLENLKQLHEAALPGTLFIVVTGQGNTVLHKAIADLKYKRQLNESSVAWTLADEALMQQHAAAVMSALTFVAIK